MGSIKFWQRGFFFSLLLFLLSGCQMGYLMKSAYNQVSLLNQRIPIEDALKDQRLTEDEKNKLLLAQEVRQFAEKDLSLNVKKNYSTFVKLDRPYVSYVVSASPKWNLDAFVWEFPFVGKVPYKGYFSELEAKEESEYIKLQGLDVYVRGVSAYSTLGWFKDPLLSSMMKYKDYDLVNTIIHESVHATLYIKSEADFNERMATFLGNKGMELFYLKKEGENSKTIEITKNENHDDELFSKFITNELTKLEKWYNQLSESQKKEELRQQRFLVIKENFKTEVKPLLKTSHWLNFDSWDLNNARLIVYKTYMKDLNDFELLYNLVGHSFVKFIDECKKLEKTSNPTQKLKERIQELTK